MKRRSRCECYRVSESEPWASYKNRRLRNPRTPCRYIIARVNESIYIFITLGTLLKSLVLYSLYFELWEPRSREPAIKIDGSETQNSILFLIAKRIYMSIKTDKVLKWEIQKVCCYPSWEFPSYRFVFRYS